MSFAARTGPRLGRAIAPLIGLTSIVSPPASGAAETRDGLAGVQSIGVIACLGDTAEIRVIGLTVFGNKTSSLPIADWRLDQRLADDAAKALSPRFHVDTAPLPAETLEDVRSASCKFTMRRLREAIRAEAKPKVDAYLVFLSGSEALPYPSNQQVSGPGAYRREHPFSGGPQTVLHLTYDVFLIDAHTAKLLKYHRGELEKGPSRSLVRSLLDVSGVTAAPDEAYDLAWPATADAFSEGQKAFLRLHLEDLGDKSVAPTLSKMGLGPPP